jgi:hypothetical protein
MNVWLYWSDVDCKYFRLFKDDKFIGVTVNTTYVDKHGLGVYRVEAVGWDQRVLSYVII